MKYLISFATIPVGRSDEYILLSMTVKDRASNVLNFIPMTVLQNFCTSISKQARHLASIKPYVSLVHSYIYHHDYCIGVC